MSISQKQLEANRRNAQKCTGPRTEHGKHVSSRNATKHGVYSRDIIVKSAAFSESRQEYDNLVASLTRQLLTPHGSESTENSAAEPLNTLEKYLIRKIANCMWRSERAIAAETAEINRQLDSVPGDLRSAELCKKIRADEFDPESATLTEQEKRRVTQNSIGVRSMPFDSAAMKISRYEMRLDRQLTSAYRLLEKLQKRRSDLFPHRKHNVSGQKDYNSELKHLK